MKFLSLCSGIEAASVAWHPLRFQCFGVAEIEAFPSAVLAHHYPNVPNFGDISKFEEWPEEMFAEIDIIVGGPPCQSFSIAGLRKGLNDDRGNLTLTYVRIIDHADNIRLRYGRPPVICVYENVPGLLSDKTNAFGNLLGGLAGEDVQLEPSGKRWTDAGCVFGPQRAVAWRVQDAQYHQLAQRRRRVFVVASAREGFDPAAVLLEFEGVRRDTPPRRETGKAASGGATGRAGERSHWDGVEHPHPTLNQSAKGSGGVGASNQELFSQRGAYLVPSTGDVSHCLNAGGMGRQDYETETLIAHTLRGNGFDASEDGTGRGTPLVPVQAFYSTESRCDNIPPPGISPPLKVGSGGGSGNPPAVTYPINTQIAMRHQALGEGTGMGIGGEDDPAFTLQAGHSHAVAFARNEQGDAAPCVAVPFSVCPDHCGGDKSGQEVAFVKEIDVSRTLDCTGADVSRKQGGVGVAQHMAVRRLTPVECERLQGFPDGYTNIPWRKKPEAPDGPRYKALGNSMAVPVMRWIGRRIAEALK